MGFCKKKKKDVISEASRNTRYGTVSVVKTAIRNAACSLAKPTSNLLISNNWRFHKAERTGAGTSLVSSLMRNLQLLLIRRLLAGFTRLQAAFRIAVFTTLPILYRVFVSQMLLRLSIANKFVLHSVLKAFRQASEMTTFFIVHTK